MLVNADGILTTPQWHPVLGLGGGSSSIGNLNRSQTIPIMNPITDEFYIYSSGKGTPTRGFIEGFLGVEHPFFANWLLQSGIAYSILNSLNRSGTFIQGADAGSADQYDYNFKIRTQQLMAQAKFMHSYQNKFYPYLLLGLGASFNNSYNYSTSVPPFLTFTRQYADNQSHSLAYRVGLGAMALS